MYSAEESRYDNMLYNRCGNSGVKLPFLSLGLWQNFGEYTSFANAREMVLGAFDLGITHFDIANNYGPPAGSAEETFGRILENDLASYRDELFISTKAGFHMWPGPYGEWGSKKNLLASLDQSLARLGIDYVDIFYHHRPDPETPLEESMDALATAVRQGKALYVGISNYSAEDTRRASQILRGMGVHCLIHQPSYSMFNRHVEDGLLQVLEEEGMGAIAFSTLAQGLLSNKYFNGIPEGSRASVGYTSLKPDTVTPEKVEKAKKLDVLAGQRGQTLSQMALAWDLRHKQITSLVMGASKLSQIEENLRTMEKMAFTAEELRQIDAILA